MKQRIIKSLFGVVAAISLIGALAICAPIALAQKPGGAEDDAGSLVYKAPRGWKHFEKSGVVFFVPPDLKRDENCVLTILPDQEFKGDPVAWFTATRKALEQGQKVVKEDKLMGKRTAAGYDPLMTASVTQDRKGHRFYRFYAARISDGRASLVTFTASSGPLFKRYDPALSEFVSSMVWVVKTKS